MALTIAPSSPRLSVSVREALFLFGLPFSKYPGKLSETGNNGSGHFAAVAESQQEMRKTRLRRWGIPKNCASSKAYSLRHAPAFPISLMTVAKSPPLFEERAPATFSQTVHRGKVPFVTSRISLIIRIASWNKPDLEPSKPARFPATDKSWHGLPKMITSTGGNSAPETVEISPHLGTSGQCLFKTFWQFLSHST